MNEEASRQSLPRGCVATVNLKMQDCASVDFEDAELDDNPMETWVRSVAYWLPVSGSNTRLVFTDGSYDPETKKAAFSVWWGEGHPFNHTQRVKGFQSVALAELLAIEWTLI